MTRPTWDQHWMNMAIGAAEMGTCPRAQVDAEIIAMLNTEGVTSAWYN